MCYTFRKIINKGFKKAARIFKSKKFIKIQKYQEIYKKCENWATLGFMSHDQNIHVAKVRPTTKLLIRIDRIFGPIAI